MTPLQGIAETLLGTLPPPKRPKSKILLDPFSWIDDLPDRFNTHDVARVLGVDNVKASQCSINAVKHKLSVRDGDKTVLMNGKRLAVYVKTNRQKPEPKDEMDWIYHFGIDSEFSAMDVSKRFGITRWAARTMVRNAVKLQLIVHVRTKCIHGGNAYIYRRVRA